MSNNTAVDEINIYKSLPRILWCQSPRPPYNSLATHDNDLCLCRLAWPFTPCVSTLICLVFLPNKGASPTSGTPDVTYPSDDAFVFCNAQDCTGMCDVVNTDTVPTDDGEFAPNFLSIYWYDSGHLLQSVRQRCSDYLYRVLLLGKRNFISADLREVAGSTEKKKKGKSSGHFLNKVNSRCVTPAPVLEQIHVAARKSFIDIITINLSAIFGLVLLTIFPLVIVSSLALNEWTSIRYALFIHLNFH